MEKKYILILFILFCHILKGQNVTNDPYVERQYSSAYSKDVIKLIVIDDEYTAVFWDCITGRNINWLSLSSRTSITSKNRSNLNLRIIDWGYYDEENFYSKEFDTQYDVKGDRRYHFYMIFPSVPVGIENITIRENISSSEEFYWEGIHLNNSAPISSGTSTYHKSSSNRSNSFEMIGSGTCFAISSKGYLATAYHVVEDAEKFRIRGINGDFNKTYKAFVLSVDKNNDLAILKIDDEKFSSIVGIPYMISEKMLDVGENINVLGYPLRAYMGDEIKLTNGLISSKSGYQGDVTTYQISASVQPGNSGGPMFDKNGNIAGIVNSRLAVESASYAVKATYLKSLIASSGQTIPLPTTNILIGKSLAEQVKLIKKYIYIIEISE